MIGYYNILVEFYKKVCYSLNYRLVHAEIRGKPALFVLSRLFPSTPNSLLTTSPLLP